MKYRALGALIAWLVMLPDGAAAQVLSAPAPVETEYADVKAKEKAVQTALADPGSTTSVLKAVRTVVGEYEALVRRYPGSAYSDDALWFAGWLSLDAFERFGDEHERAASLRLWRALAMQYPASKLAKQVPVQVTRAERARPGLSPEPPAQQPPAAAGDARVAAAPSSGKAAVYTASIPTSPARTLSRSPAVLREIRRTVLPDAVRVTLELDREVEFHDERLADPDRVFVDLLATSAVANLKDRTVRFDGDGDLVHQVRIGRHPNATTRVVLDLTGIASYSVYPIYNPYRLVVECVRLAPLEASLPAAPLMLVLPSRTIVPSFARGMVALPIGIAPREDPPPPLESSPLPSVAAAPAAPPARNIGGGFSMARQLGLTVSRIVIDPGHGGHDPGASGKGVTEAGIVLDVALRLEKLLSNVPGVDVILTRRTDDFIGLQERTAIANREGADLFLSIHANASGNLQAHGVETYFLNFATTTTAAAVAARENASSGQPMAALPDFVKTIALNNKLDESRDFATQIQRALIEGLRGSNRSLRDLGVKQAPFVVLIGAAMPSVLAEISFLTNAQEVKLLRGPAYRQKIAEALFDAIRKYQGSLKNESKAAQ